MNRKKRPSPFALSLPLVTAALLITCGAKTPGPQAERPAGPQAAPAAQSQPRPGLTEDERNTIDIVKRTKNSVVFVTNIQHVRDSFFLTVERERKERQVPITLVRID